MGISWIKKTIHPVKRHGSHLLVIGRPSVHDSSSSFDAPETPSKSLVGTSDASMLFSPPAILKETALPDDSGAGFSTDSLNIQQDSLYRSNQSVSMSQNSFGGSKPLSGLENRNTGANSGNGGGSNNGSGNGGNKKGQGNSSPKSKLDVRWNMIACGKTRPTLEMTEQARQYLNIPLKPRSLDL